MKKKNRTVVYIFTIWKFSLLYPVRNNAPLLPPGQRPSGPAAAVGLDFRIIPAGFNALLEFLTGFTL